MSGAAAHYAALSRRSVVTMLRQPAAFGPPLFFPLMFLALTAAAFAETIHLPGFPEVDSFLQFMIATTVVQATLFGSIQAGSDMATDIERGFFERLLASPVTRSSIIVGRLAGSATLALMQTVLFFSVALLFGLEVEGGVAAIVLIGIVAVVFAAGLGALNTAFALKTGSTEAVQGMFPLIFALLFLSSAFFPRSLMNGWFKSAATINPLSHLIEGLREQVITGIDIAAWTTALAIATGVLLLGVVLSLSALRGRLIRAHT